MAKRTERENIDRIQAALLRIENAARQELDRAKEAKNAAHVNQWTHVLADALKIHAEWTDRLSTSFPEFSDEVVTDGPVVFGGGR